jgi:tetratricopeptide (TPR) repeat protein
MTQPRFSGFCVAVLALAFSPSGARAAQAVPKAGEQVPAPAGDTQILEVARQGMHQLMDGDLDGALQRFQEVQRQDPASPLSYLFEADVYWWKIYLTTGNLIDPDVFDVVSKDTSPDDGTFMSYDQECISRAEARVKANQDVARSLLYEGMAYGLLARFYGLRDNDLPTARAGKKMRAALLQALQLDPSLTDADLGLGIYNYFVDTLPAIVKLLKFFIGLPGGSRETGLQQLESVAKKGDLASGEAQFYLAKDFSRTNERQYAKSLALFQDLASKYPDNMLWQLVVGSLEIRTGHADEGEALYRKVLARSAQGTTVVAQAIHTQAQQALSRRHPEAATTSQAMGEVPIRP